MAQKASGIRHNEEKRNRKQQGVVTLEIDGMVGNRYQ